MSIQKYHVSKNLFDKNNYLEYNGYFNKLSGTITILYESNNKIVYIPCKPNTTYTASRIAGKRFAVGCSVDVPSNGVTVYNVDGSALGATSLTVTTTADAKYLVAYIRNGNIAGESSLTDIIDSLQIEEGKAATPYEPYGNTWNSIPYRKYGTETDIITDLPQEIITDGQPIEANLFDLSAYYAVDSGITNISIDNGAITYNASSQYGAIRYGFNLSVSDVFTVGLGSDSDKTRLELRYLKNNAQVGETIVIQKGNYQIIRGGNEYDAFSIYISNGTYTGICKASNIMLNAGSTALPYQPYAPTIIKGNLLRSGTPSPSSPIYPSECGDRTENLWDENYTNISSSVTYKPIYVGEGTFTLSSTIPDGLNSIRNLFFLAGDVTSGVASDINGVAIGVTRTVVSVDGYVTIAYRSSVSGNTNSPADFDTMLNSDSTALPYEPYGYKIPLALNFTTYPVYIKEPLRKIDNDIDIIEANGVVTRNVKKLVFEGTEDWSKSRSDDTAFFKLQLSDYKLQTSALCSHFEYTTVSQTGTALGFYISPSGGAVRIRPANVASTSLTDFTQFLADQYSAGTPVTIYYVADTPTTEQVIVPTLPTTGTPEQFDVNTTLKPSEVDLTYHGWHPMSDVHKYHVSTNLIDCEIEDGGYSSTTGKKTSGNYYRTADYIAVEPNTDYVFGKGGVNIAIYVCLYTSDKTFIERLYPRSGEYFTTSESTYYITMYRSNIETSEQWQLNKGQSILLYEAYYEPYWE